MRTTLRRRHTSHSLGPQVWVLVLASIASLMMALDQLVLSSALTTIQRSLGASIEGLQWTVNAYDLTVAALLLPAAALGDRFGRRRIFALGMAVFGASSAVAALSPTLGMLIAARAVQGCGTALVTALSLALVSAAFPAQRRGAALGTLQGILGLGLIAGPVLGGGIAGGLDWRRISGSTFRSRRSSCPWCCGASRRAAATSAPWTCPGSG